MAASAALETAQAALAGRVDQEILGLVAGDGFARQSAIEAMTLRRCTMGLIALRATGR